MKCDKCKKDFPELELDESHDIPKYMGGKDADGRHWLCKDCHEKYEFWVMRTFLWHVLLKRATEEDMKKGRAIARRIRDKFFGEKEK